MWNFAIVMKRMSLLPFFFFCLTLARAQTGLRTLVTSGPVVAGESFQVQYVLSGAEKEDEVLPPDFRNFRRISGPDVYTAAGYGANGPLTMKNTVYTLAAIRPGIYTLPAATARIDGRLVKGEEVTITVISKEEAIARKILPPDLPVNTEYYLRPGEDAAQKIRNNLFIRVSVDKRSCYVGQPVTATFKLYSRLESRSDIVKNPGFYGFTVQDMIGLKDKLSSAEIVNGKRFDVHTVRKVQLYPLQAGTFTIDPMEVTNRVEFSAKAIGRDPDQEITEGVYTREDPVAYGQQVFESTMQTEAVTVKVNALPLKNQPAAFNGAIGSFSIAAEVDEKKQGVNKEGMLEVIVSGKGNFTQLAAPAVQWPDGIEGFEPEIKDTFDISVSPLKGERRFIYRFVASRAGEYTIPAVTFPYFDPDSNRYISRSTKEIRLNITAAGSPAENTQPGSAPALIKKEKSKWLLACAALLVLLAAGLFYFIQKRKSRQGAKGSLPGKEALPAPDELLAGVREKLTGTDKDFYTALRAGIWQYIGTRLHLSGSRMSKAALGTALANKGIKTAQQDELSMLLQQCETGIFTGAITGQVKEEMLEKARQLLNDLEQQLG